MNRKIAPLAGLLSLLALGACSTVDETPAPPPPPPVRIAVPNPPPVAVMPAAAPSLRPDQPMVPRPGGAADRALRAQGVYLARPHRIGEFDHLMITEVWRHDPVLGPEPQVGEEWMPGHLRTPIKGDPDFALICVTATPRGRTMTIAIFKDDRLVPEGETVAQLRAAVRASHADAVPARTYPAAPTAEQLVATAAEVYLVRLEPTDDGRLAYHVSEVWRHTRPGAAPEPGAPVPGWPARPAGAGVSSGDAAVFFQLPPRAPGDLGRHTERMVVMVHNGYLWGAVSLSDLHQSVVAASPPEPQPEPAPPAARVPAAATAAPGD